MPRKVRKWICAKSYKHAYTFKVRGKIIQNIRLYVCGCMCVSISSVLSEGIWKLWYFCMHVCACVSCPSSSYLTAYRLWWSWAECSMKNKKDEKYAEEIKLVNESGSLLGGSWLGWSFDLMRLNSSGLGRLLSLSKTEIAFTKR